MDEIILASASPRRSQLLTQVGITHKIIPSEYEEKECADTPEETVLRFAKAKARDVLQKVDSGTIVLGADTVVACDGTILGKPGTKENAFKILKLLQNRSHEVYTGVSILQKQGNTIKESSFVEETKVCFAAMSDQDILDYIETGDCMDKAGAYGIQGVCAAYITGIVGDYNNVVGLPVGRVYRELRKF